MTAAAGGGHGRTVPSPVCQCVAALAWATLAGCGGRLAEGDLDGGAAAESGASPPTGSANADFDATRQEAAPPSGSTSPGSPPSPALSGSPSTAFFICPPGPPALEGSCDPVGLVCKYADFAACPAFECAENGRWRTGPPGC